MQNAVFMSARTGAERLNVHRDCITQWLRELEHYGFMSKCAVLSSDRMAKPSPLTIG
jgi:hypothetical protein